jgi:uncharacterized protein YjiK
MSKVHHFLIPIIFFFSCSSKSDQRSSVSEHFPYDLNSPDKKYFLPEPLREISGLSALPNGQLACVQDEKGILFIFDTNSGQIVKEIKFGKTGDYEGIEVVGEQVFVIKSNGEITVFNLKNEGEKPEVIRTSLQVRNDVEGLGYNHENNSLLIACKGKPDVNGNGFKGKCVYEYSLADKKFNDQPFLNLTKEDLNIETNKIKLSGIMMHPTTGQIFLLTSSGLFFICEKNKVSATFLLAPSLYTQAEGICISDKGSLFISSEGGSGKGYILRFDPKN